MGDQPEDIEKQIGSLILKFVRQRGNRKSKCKLNYCMFLSSGKDSDSVVNVHTNSVGFAVVFKLFGYSLIRQHFIETKSITI